MLQQLVGVGHVVVSFVISIYFLWAPARFDYFYLVYFLLVNISWTLFKNECIVSYLFKVLENPGYQMGSTTDEADYGSVLGPTGSALFLNYVLLMYTVNLVVIGLRLPQRNNKNLIVLTGVSYILYIAMLRQVENPDVKIALQTIHGLVNAFVLSQISSSFAFGSYS